MDKNKLKELKKITIDVRRNTIETLRYAGSGHIGGSFSAIEIMVYLYFYKMNIDPRNALKKDRDIFILSKGHASSGFYCVLQKRGFFPKEELKTYRKINSKLQGHPLIDSVPGIECSSGSLGQGLSYGLGCAIGYKKRRFKNNIYVLTGDGELEEGQIWEAAMLQGHLKLDNLVTIVDSNKLQLDDFTDNITGVNYKLKEKFNAFGFNAIEIDGNDFEEIDDAFTKLKMNEANVIIMNTVKGKGISFMENRVEWHSKKINDEDYKEAMKELDDQEAALND